MLSSSSTSDHRRGIESPMDVDRKGPSIFASLTAAAASNNAAESSTSSSTSASTTSTAGSASAPSLSTSIFGSAAASSFKFEMPKASPSPTFRSTAATLAGSDDSFSTLRFSTALSQSLPRDSGIAHEQDRHGNQGNGTDPSPYPTSTPLPSLGARPSPLDDSFDLSDQLSGVATPVSPNSPIKLNLDIDNDSDDQDGPSVFDGTPLARPARVARRLSKGFVRRFTASSAAAAAEASAQLDADEPAPTTPTLGKHKRITARAPPRSSARTITQRNVFTHHDSDSDHPPPPFTSTPASPRATQLPSLAPTSTTPSRRLRHCDDPLPSTPGITNANHSSMPPPSSSHRPNPRSTPGSNHLNSTPNRTPGHTPRLGNLNPTLTPRGTPRHKRPRRDYDDSDHHTDYGSGDDNDMYDAGGADASIMYLGERFHGHNHQYMPPPPPMQHTPYGFAHQPQMWVQQPFYPYATPQGVHVHPQVIYGPPPAQPQFLMHGQQQSYMRRPHPMLNSDDEMSDEGMDGMGHGAGGEASVTHYSHSHSRTARASHFSVQSYMNSFKVIVATCVSSSALVVLAYVIYLQIMTGHAAHVTGIQVEMQACARKFQENQCGASSGRPPLLADACLQWEQCMARDPHKEAHYVTIIFKSLSEGANVVVANLSTKALVFYGTLAVALVLAFRASWCCASRRKERGRSKSRSRKQQQQQREADDGSDVDQGGYQGGNGPRRMQEPAPVPGDFMGAGGPMTMGGAPMAIMPPPSSTTRHMHQQRGYAPLQQQQPSPFGTPVFQNGYYQDARSTPGSAGRMGISGGGYGQRQQQQQQETPSRMPTAGSMRRRRQG